MTPVAVMLRVRGATVPPYQDRVFPSFEPLVGTHYEAKFDFTLYAQPSANGLALLLVYNRLLFGGRAEFSAPTAESTRRAASVLRVGLARVFPRLASIRVEYAWGGRVAFTRDQLPHAGRLDGLHYAGGYCGHGVAMATYLGAIVGRRIAGEPIEHPLIDDRFPAIPFYRGNPWFLPLVGAYYKVKDWLQ